MIHLTSITSTFFINLLNRLGCKPPPPEGFDLINTVQPVSIVDQDVNLNVSFTEPAFVTPVGGITAAPGAGAVLADTGPLAAGNWEFLIIVNMFDGANTLRVDVEHRDAANAANIWSGGIYHGSTGAGFANYPPFKIGKTVALNERLRLTNVNAAAAGGRVTALIFARQTA